jgi:hypothetical protein
MVAKQAGTELPDEIQTRPQPHQRRLQVLATVNRAHYSLRPRCYVGSCPNSDVRMIMTL